MFSSPVIAKISQETLAEMIGAKRAGGSRGLCLPKNPSDAKVGQLFEGVDWPEPIALWNPVCADVLVLPSGDLDAVCFEVGQC